MPLPILLVQYLSVLGTVLRKSFTGAFSSNSSLRRRCNPNHNKFSSLSNTTVVAIFPKLCLWRRSLCSNLRGIGLEKLYRATLISSSISKLCYLNLHLYNVSKFHVTGSRSNLIQYGKQQTVSERNLHGQNCPTSQMKVSRQNVCTPIFLLCVFISLFSLEYRINKTYWKLLTIVGNTTY